MNVLDCAFCRRLVAADKPSSEDVVWCFPHSVAFLGTWQYYRGYCVLAARTHATELSGLADVERRAYFDEMCLLARAIELYARPHKLNYEILGNQVPHLHWHIFPRSKDDPQALQPVWLALDQAERDPEIRRRYEADTDNRAATVANLRQHLFTLGAPVFS